MSDLLNEFLARDLTAVEEDKLAAWLSASPENSGRMSEAMADLYHETGLPTPLLPDTPSDDLTPSGKFPKMVVIIPLFLLLAAFSTYRWYAAKVSVVAPIRTSKPQKISEEEVSSQDKANASQSAPLRKKVEELSIVVNPVAISLVTVRVVDNQNHETKVLYAGILPPGKRSFCWDGKTQKGAVAHPGVYFIEVLSGPHLLRREIHVKNP